MPAEAVNPSAALASAYFKLHPDEATEVLEDETPEEIATLLPTLETAQASTVIERLSERLAVECLRALPGPELNRLLKEVNPSRAAILLGRLEPEVREARLAELDAATARELRDILSFPADSAGQLMDTHVFTFPPRTTVKDTLAALAAGPRRDYRNVFVVDAGGRLLGMLPLARVALAPPRRRLEQLLSGTPLAVNATAPRDDVTAILDAGNISTLPVIDGQNRLLGVIRYDALIQAVKEDATADLATLVGASKDELALSPALFAVRKRLPWLNINLVTAFLAAAVVGIFESTIAQFTALAVLLPVVAGQSGNTGAQALAVVIRGLALREIRVHDYAAVLLKESLVGAVNGIAIATVTALGVLLWSRSLGLCLVIFLAMILSMAIASVSGAAIPLVLSALRQDPAQSGSIILTTVTDIIGFFSFLGLATVLSTLL